MFLVLDNIISASLLWLLLTLFSRSQNSSQNLTESWIVIFAMLIIDWVLRLTVAPFIGSFTALIHMVALYFVIAKVCDLDRGRTIRICVWYFLISFLMKLFLILLFS